RSAPRRHIPPRARTPRNRTTVVERSSGHVAEQITHVMRDSLGKLAIGSLRSGELFDTSANGLDKRFDIDDDSIYRQVTLVCRGGTVLPLIVDRAGFTRGA